MDILTAIGHKGTILLLERGYKTLGWKDTDFHQDIKVANKIIFTFSEKERKKIELIPCPYEGCVVLA